MNERTDPPSTRELQTELSAMRTAVALDRTLLAWIRTSLSLIGFGFALARFVHDLLLHGYLHGVDTQWPKMLGLSMMVLGVLGLAGGVAEHVISIKKLKTETKVSYWSASLFVCITVAVIGFLLLVNLMKDLSVPAVLNK